MSQADTTCKDCRAPIRWVCVKPRKFKPCDPVPVGDVQAETASLVVLRQRTSDPESGSLYANETARRLESQGHISTTATVLRVHQCQTTTKRKS